MSSKQKYIVKITEHFFDGHGEESPGETTIFVTDNEIYSKLDVSLYYYDLERIELYKKKKKEGYSIEAMICDEDSLHAEDGYHCTAETLSVEKISDERAEEIKNILKLYNEI